MFYGGFAFLPLLWLVNFMYFFKTSRKPTAPKELKKCKRLNKKKKSETAAMLLMNYRKTCTFPWQVVLYGLSY
jgi:hypothetical protein